MTGPDAEAAHLLARSHRFTLGEPRTITVTGDGARVIFLRTQSGTDAVTCLWSLDLATGDEHLLADPRRLLGGATEEVSPEERSRRERIRESAVGIVDYSLNRLGRVAAFALSGRLFVLDVASGDVRELAVTGSIRDPRLDPTGGHVCFLAGGGLSVVDLDAASVLELSAGTAEVSFGAPEFVAAEEMNRHRGYWWSPFGDRLLVARVDTSGVDRWWLSEPSMPGHVPTDNAYPAAGRPNAEVSLHLFDLHGGVVSVDWDGERLPFLVTVTWTAGAPLTLALMSRDQKRLEVHTVDVTDGHTEVVHVDTDPAWVYLVPGTPGWLPDGRLVRASQSESTSRLVIGEQHKTPAGLQLHEVVDIGSTVLFTASTEPTEQHVYVYDPADDAGLIRLTDLPGVHECAAGAGMIVIISETLDRDGRTVRVLRGSQELARLNSRAAPPPYAPKVTLLSVGRRELRTAVLFPRDETRPAGPLPVLMDPYGGPLSQRVRKARRLFYEPQWLADHGFAVVVADGRGSPARGPEWERAVHLDFAGPVLEDQLEALERVGEHYPGELDLDRVAIRGWSFGGYLAALAVLRRPDVFKAGIAGAPVTDWRLYDSVASERYLGDPGEQAEAYTRASLLELASGLQRPLLLVHGLADDNVHPSHSFRLSEQLLLSGRPHQLLPLPGVTHLVWQPEVLSGLLRLQVAFLRRWIGPSPDTYESGSTS